MRWYKVEGGACTTDGRACRWKIRNSPRALVYEDAGVDRSDTPAFELSNELESWEWADSYRSCLLRSTNQDATELSRGFARSGGPKYSGTGSPYSVKLAVRALAHLIRFPVTNIREELVC
jgi:hypothetical protein